MTRYSAYLGSAGFAALAAGPVFSLGVLLGPCVTSPASVFAPPDPKTIGPVVLGMLLITGVSVLFGAMLAIVPNIVGMHTMGWLGARSVGLQLPAAWALAGASAAGGPAWFLQTSPDTSPFVFAFALTGAVCAVICRYRMEWDDAAVA